MGKWDATREPEVLGQLLALLAHDLRNPLSALHSNLGYLRTVAARSELSDPDIPEAINDGLVSCDGLSHIIDNVGFLSQQLRESPPAPPSSGAVVRLVREAVGRVEAFARSHGVMLSQAATDRSQGVQVNVSRDVFSRAVTNVVRNAVLFSPSGATVAVDVDAEDEKAIITVHDTGPTMPLGSEQQHFGLDGQLAAKRGNDGRYSRWMGLFIADLAAELAGGALAIVTARAPFTNAMAITLPLGARDSMTDAV